MQSLCERIGRKVFFADDLVVTGFIKHGNGDACTLVCTVECDGDILGCSGIIIDKKIYMGRGEAGEIGHMCIELNGKKCACGASGCWERYASASALAQMADEAIKANPESILAKTAGGALPDGKTVFAAIEYGCAVAKEIVDKYLDYLAIGINNIINVFSPEAIIISGGLSEAGDALALPLADRLSTKVMIKFSRLGNDAGIIGAALLCRI